MTLDWVPLNFKLLSQWQNWVIIVLMLIIAGVALDLLASTVAPEHSPALSA